jgi:hypothetical protein
MEHPYVSECIVQQYMGGIAERMERFGTTNRYCVNHRFVHTRNLHHFSSIDEVGFEVNEIDEVFDRVNLFDSLPSGTGAGIGY